MLVTNKLFISYYQYITEFMGQNFNKDWEILANYVGTDGSGISRYGIQGLVGQPLVLRYLSQELAYLADGIDFDFVAANVVGGMVLGWEMREHLERIRGRGEIPFVYVRQGFKKGGHGELEVGTRNNPLIEKGMDAVLVDIEENPDTFRERITSSVDGLTEGGYNVNGTATPVQPTISGISGDLDQVYLVNTTNLLETIRSGRKKGIEFEAPSEKPDYEKGSLEDTGLKIIDGGALEIRDVDAGEESFLYRSGNRGPGYLMIKGLVGQPSIMKYLVRQLALNLLEKGYRVDGTSWNFSWERRYLMYV
jgi:hypothetical protein